MSPNSDVIGINYDGTTAGKKRPSAPNRLSPRNSLDRLAGRPCLRCGAGLSWLGGPVRHHRAGGGEPLSPVWPSRGIDPVAYFVDAQPEVGLADFEASAAGAVWRFRNEGNRASFVAHPEIYGPQFGGYDPVDLARGVTVAGNPRFWLISGQRLYLFSREEARDAFAADPARVLREANARWPALEQDLAQ